MTDTSDFLLSRRSIVVRNMVEPGPTDEDLEKILRAGMRVPDHGRLTPWRFIVIRGDARDKMGKVLGEAFRMANPDSIDEQVEIEEERFARAPIVIAVLSRTVPKHKIPEWEQVLSSGAACQNLLTSGGPRANQRGSGKNHAGWYAGARSWPPDAVALHRYPRRRARQNGQGAG